MSDATTEPRSIEIGSEETEILSALAEVTALAGVEDVTDLSLYGPVDARFAPAVAELTQLISFRAMGSVHADVVAAACSLTGLTRLIISSELPIAGGFVGLDKLTALQLLGVVGPDLTGEGIEVLGQLPLLETLLISSAVFDLAQLSGLAGCSALNMLVLRDLPDVDDQSVPYLATLPPVGAIRISAQGKSDLDTFSLSAKVWLSRVRPDLSLNGFSATPKAVAKYVAAGLGADPRTGEMELAG